MKAILLCFAGVFAATTANSVVLIDNGPWITGRGNGFAGADTSAIESGYNAYGFYWFEGASNGPRRVADDFTVPAGETWTLATLTWRGFQDVLIDSTYISVFVTLYSGNPRTGGAVLAGDYTTNRLMGTGTFSNVYRVDTDPMDTDRPVMNLTMDMAWAPPLAAGTYWVGASSRGLSGGGRAKVAPFANPVVPHRDTDNAIEYAFGMWRIVDGNFGLPGVQRQDFPFVLEGTRSTSEATVRPTSFSFFRGVLVSGDIQSLHEPDDNRLVGRPGVVLNQAERPIQIVIEGPAPGATASQIKIVVEAHCNIPNINQQIDGFDFVAASYTQVDSRTMPTADLRLELVLPGTASNYIGPGNVLRARISYKEAGPVFSYPWFARIDEATWRLTP